ncbi:MAG: hypothetical protein ACFCBV_10285 [Phycisphaerales bacterium]
MEDQPQDNPATPFQNDLRIELYKSLRAEAAKYVERVPGLWLQKFAMLGGIVVFLFATDRQAFGNEASDALFPIAAVIMCVLTGLIDAKMLEYALHARIISLYIRDHFRDASVGGYESFLWGYGSNLPARRLAWLRNWTTIAVTTVSSLATIIAACWMAEERTGHQFWINVAWVGALIYLGGSVGVAHLLFRAGAVTLRAENRPTS